MEPRQQEAGFKRLDVLPAYRLVCDAVEREIVAGRLRQGDKLPTESALAQQFGVNRSTVREGIRLLEQSGLVRREGGKRLHVSLPHARELATRASRALVMHQVTFRELWEAAIEIEPITVGLAVGRCGADEIASLESTILQMESSGDDIDRFVRLDISFHDLIAKASRNRVLQLAREPLSLLFLPAGRAILPRLRTQKRVIDAHRVIAAALASGDRAEAERWMRRHMEDFRRGYERTGLDLDKPLDLASLGMDPDVR